MLIYDSYVCSCNKPREVFLPAKVYLCFGGEDASLLLLKDGKILVCGSNAFCKLGFSSNCKKLCTFRVLNGFQENVIDVGLSSSSTVMLCESGDVILMGKCGSRIYTRPQRISLLYANLYVSEGVELMLVCIP